MITYDDAAFRAACPVFANTTTYPQSLTEGWWSTATNFVSVCDNACFNLNGAARALGINYMAGAIGQITAIIAAGQVPALVTEARIDKIEVTSSPPPNPTQFTWWLSLTPYGQMLAALLAIKGAGGMYIGGNPERAGFRRVGGLFG